MCLTRSLLYNSTPLIVKAGVPQGCISGPTLIFIYMNELGVGPDPANPLPLLWR